MTPPSSHRELLLFEAEKLAAPLQQTSWPPMSYMAIPSLLSAADKLIRRMEAHTSRDEELARALVRMRQLRRDVHRVR